MRQGGTESNIGHIKRFRVNLDTLISANGKHILCSPELVEASDKKNIKEEERKKEESWCFKVKVFLKRSDPNRYMDFWTESQNSGHLDNNMYPDSENDVLDLMVVRQSEAFNSALIANTDRGQGGRCSGSRNSRGRGRDFNFVQNGKNRRSSRAPPRTVLVAGTNGRTCNVMCFRCYLWGHYSDHCLEERSSGANIGVNLTQQHVIDASKSMCTLGTIELFQFLNCELIKVIYSVSTLLCHDSLVLL